VRGSNFGIADKYRKTSPPSDFQNKYLPNRVEPNGIRAFSIVERHLVTQTLDYCRRRCPIITGVPTFSKATPPVGVLIANLAVPFSGKNNKIEVKKKIRFFSRNCVFMFDYVLKPVGKHKVLRNDCFALKGTVTRTRAEKY